MIMHALVMALSTVAGKIEREGCRMHVFSPPSHSSCFISIWTLSSASYDGTYVSEWAVRIVFGTPLWSIFKWQTTTLLLLLFPSCIPYSYYPSLNYHVYWEIQSTTWPPFTCNNDDVELSNRFQKLCLLFHSSEQKPSWPSYGSQPTLFSKATRCVVNGIKRKLVDI